MTAIIYRACFWLQRESLTFKFISVSNGVEVNMSEAGVYMIANLTVNDADEYRKYEKGFFPILKKFGGEFITFDDNHETLEGTDPLEGRVIIFKFPSEKAAKNWYNDAEYQALSEFRRSGTVLKALTLVHELAPRG